MYFNAEVSTLNRFRQAGFSLLELIAVVAILAIIAVVSIPSISPVNPLRLDRAAQLYAQAIRYARAESLRDNKLYGFRDKDNLRNIRVKSVDQTATPWTFIDDVYHPVSKKIYHVELDELPGMAGITTNQTPVFRGSCSSPRRIYFDHHGSAWCLQDNTVALTELTINLSLDNQTRSVILDGFSGRVTIQ